MWTKRSQQYHFQDTQRKRRLRLQLRICPGEVLSKIITFAVTEGIHGKTLRNIFRRDGTGTVRLLLGIIRCGAHGDNLTISACINIRRTLLHAAGMDETLETAVT